MICLLMLGVAVRLIVIQAYRPALLFPDSWPYLTGARTLKLFPERPGGYSFFLKPILDLTGESLTAIQVVQHILGVLLAVACYAFLVRRGLPTWGAALAVTPLLFDPLALILEHYVLTDVLFETLVVLACLVLLWSRRPSLAAVVIAGALIGMAGTVRGAGIFLLALFLVAAVCVRVRWYKVVALVVAGLVPMAAYSVAFHQQHGEYAVSNAGPRFLYARLAPIVRCEDPDLDLPRYERSLCPRVPVDQRPPGNAYMWDKGKGPASRVVPPADMTQMEVLKDFDKRVMRAQPTVFAKAALADFLRGFMPSRTYQTEHPARFWLFTDHYLSWDLFRRPGQPLPELIRDASYDPEAARFMTSYGKLLYLPGPVAGILLLTAASAALGIGRARASGDRVAIGLLAGTCVLIMLTGSALAGFSWRYQLPQLSLLPMAGALGIAALVRGRAPGQPPPGAPLRPLDRGAEWLASLPLPAQWRATLSKRADQGVLQVVLAVVTGAVLAVLAAVIAVTSGWFRTDVAAVMGAGLGVVVATTLLVARARAAPGPPSTPAPETMPERHAHARD